MELILLFVLLSLFSGRRRCYHYGPFGYHHRFHHHHHFGHHHHCGHHHHF